MKAAKPYEAIIPIYQRLAGEYRDAIIAAKFKPGDLIDSISQIQTKHNVSRETAKAVLKILADEGYIVQHAGKGSFVSDIRPPKKIWGIILPFYSIVYEDLLHRITAQASALGREVQHFVSYNQWQEETRLVGWMVSERFEVVIVVPTLDESKASHFYRRLPAGRTLVTLMDHTMSGSYFSYVIQSYDLGVKRGVQHLLGRGSGSVAFIRNEIWAGRNLVQEVMEETFTAIMKQERPALEPVIVERISDVTVELLREKNVSGIFCCDDTDAVRIIGRLRESGVAVPADMGVVSYGNTDLARYFSPAITSVDGHTGEMAGKMVSIIKDGLQGKDISYCQFIIQPDLIIRET